MDLFCQPSPDNFTPYQRLTCHILFPLYKQCTRNKARSVQIRSSHSSQRPKSGIKLTQPSKFLGQLPKVNHMVIPDNTPVKNCLKISRIKQKKKKITENVEIPQAISIPKQVKEHNFNFQMPVNICQPEIKRETTLTKKKFQQKFNWKTIPDNNKIKHQYKIERRTTENTLQLHKVFEQTYATYAQTNGMRSIQNSKNNNDGNTEQIIREPEWLAKMKSEDSLIHSRQIGPISQTPNSVIVDSNVSNAYDFYGIDEIQTVITHSLVSEPSPDLSTDIILDQSFVEWTYQTGFRTKTEPNQPQKQQF